MKQYSLSEGSKSYHDEAYIYEHFSQVEDIPGNILRFLEPLVKSKDVLDLGCGTGKYLVSLAPLAKSYCGLDISSDQLGIAKSKVNNICNVNFLCSSAESINLPNESIDTIISTWVLSTILDEKRRVKALKEAERVLRTNGNIYLVENDIGGEFEMIRGRYPDITRTKTYNGWVEAQGFKIAKRLNTYFEFESLEEAKKVITSIWGKEAATKVKGKRIYHKILIYHKKKSDIE
ncbi:MAG: class I SAM-dependent methyltransferase [Candidatus Woesearchaeota archaeon]